ncbi:MAG TPA: chromate resistance protein ChrB domain-containing protein [Xanthobacteraceae bacterium]|nr:chromate resistance protein ChrB domain-containing protein [Xanthobacteraceae bacterium]
MSVNFSISPQDLWSLIATPRAPQVIDVRRREARDSSLGVLPGARWCDAREVARWSGTLDRARPIAVACKAGHELSQSVVAELRAAGFSARLVSGGYAAWEDAGLPLVSRQQLDRVLPQRPSLWVTRRRPKIDRVACPWLIRRLLDPDARFLYVEPSDVPGVAHETGAIPFDIDGVEISHDGPLCSFDALLKIFGLETEPSLVRLAMIVRGADTARHELAPEAAGLHAVSLGLSALAGDDDHGMIAQGFTVYDALFAWIRFAAEEQHNWPVTPAKQA